MKPTTEDGMNMMREIKLYERSFKANWPLEQNEREEVIVAMLRVLRNSTRAREQVAAAKVLIAADSLNTRRERNEIADTGSQRAEQTARLRAAMQTPEGRAMMLAATEAMLGETKPTEVPTTEGIETSDSEGRSESQDGKDRSSQQ